MSYTEFLGPVEDPRIFYFRGNHPEIKLLKRLIIIWKS